MKKQERKNFLQDIKDYIFLLSPQFQYGLKYHIVNGLCIIFSEVSRKLIEIYFYMTIINMIIDGKSILNTIFVTLLFIFARVLSRLLQYDPLAYLAPEWQNDTYAKISAEVIKQAIGCNYKNFDQSEFYDNYTAAVNEFANRSWEAIDRFWGILANFISIGAIVSVIITMSPMYIVVSILAIIINVIVNKFESDFLSKRWEEMRKKSRRNKYVSRVVSLRENAADLRSTKVGEKILHMHYKAYEERKEVYKGYKAKTIAANLWNYGGVMVVDLIAIIYTIFSAAKGIIGIGDFTGTITASSELYWSLSSITSVYNRIHDAALYSRQIQKFFHAPSDIEKSKKTDEGADVTNKPFGIELKNVGFSYKDNSSTGFALKNISMSIKPGQKIAIVGENGAGKSTLTKLLLRLYDTTVGEVLINGRSIKEYDVHELRNEIGVAFQNTNLYAMSLAENIKLYHEVSDEKLMEIVQKLGLDKVLEKNRCGLEVQLTKEFDNNGIELSGGEKQKLGLARLFTGSFGLLILDEPSAALDPIAEYELNKVILELRDTTTIMISHRLSTVRDADCIYLIENGEILEYGTHHELMRYNGKYSEMFNMQAENYLKEIEE